MKEAKRCSIVFSLAETLKDYPPLGGPEPDYLKWLDTLLFAETGNASDEATYGKHSAEVQDAWKVYGEAIEATQGLLELHRKNPSLFQEIARQFSVLPCLMSRHPAADEFNRRLFEFSHIGENSLLCQQGPHGRHYAHQSWPVRYAYALITTIDLTLDTYADRLPMFAEFYRYGIKHPIHPEDTEEILRKGKWTEEQKEEIRRNYRDAYRILPRWAKGLLRLRRPFSQDSVIQYWRKGKEMMLEEMPDFHQRPEWKSYRTRKYKDGAKVGTIQHAIFKDILAALRTIAGPNKGANGKRSRKPLKPGS